MHAKRAILIAALLSAVLLSGCTSSRSVLTASPGYNEELSELRIKIRPLGFVPSFAVVPAGTTITWANDDMMPHILSFDGVTSPELEPGAEWSYKFIEPGVYHYRCRITPQRGVIVVEEQEEAGEPEGEPEEPEPE